MFDFPTPKYRKICAKVTSGVRFGVGFVVERACGTECHSCKGTPFERKCRFFDFRPHYNVRLEQKAGKPEHNVRGHINTENCMSDMEILEPG